MQVVGVLPDGLQVAWSVAGVSIMPFCSRFSFRGVSALTVLMFKVMVPLHNVGRFCAHSGFGPG